MDLLDGIDVACPACGHHSRYPKVHAGKLVSCPACKHEHVIPVTKEASGIQAAISTAPSAPSKPPTAMPAKPNTQPLANKPTDEKIVFVCASCGYRARIPAQYAGMAVKCPSCNAAQIANADGSGISTGNTVQMSKLATPGHKTTIRPGNILFICSQCNFEAQLAKHYVGKAIRCPSCHAPQVVAGDPPPKEPAALERHKPASGESVAPTSDPRFICVGCGYRARIPAQYMGLAVTCPKCDTVQIATPEEHEGPATGDTVAISKMQTAADGAQIANPQVSVAPVEPGIKMPTSKAAPVTATIPAKSAPAAAAGGGDKVRFTCSACGFKARLPASYAGESIHCPSCNAVQLVLRSGQLSPNATGNTQFLPVVQTAEPVASPDAIATPTHAPSRVVPVSSDPEVPPIAKPAASVAKPAAPAMTKPALPPSPNPWILLRSSEAPKAPMATPPAVPVAQPAGTAKAQATIDDLLNFEDPPKEEPAGKVVGRSSDRLTVVGAKITTPPTGKIATPLPETPAAKTTTPLPEEPVAKTTTPLPETPAAKTTTPLPEEPVAKITTPLPEKPAAALPEIDEEPPSDPIAAKPAAKAGLNKPAAKSDRTTKSSRPVPSDDVPAPQPKQSNTLVVVIAIFGLALLGGLGFLGLQVMDSNKQITDMTGKISEMDVALREAREEVQQTNKKLAQAEEDAKLAKEQAELASKKQSEEAAARKASEDKAAELEAKLKAAEDAAAKAAAEDAAAKAAAAKEAADQAPADNPDFKISE